MKNKIGILLVVVWVAITSFGGGLAIGLKVNQTGGQILTGVSTYDFTGEDVFQAVNKHRESLGLTPIVLQENFCNNIAQRYLDVTKPDNADIAHAGFKTWANKYIPKGWTVGEILVKTNTPQSAISSWVGSPSHRLILEDPLNIYGCTYANGGWAIVEMGHPINK